ncbi:MAG: hypothetical protein OSA23_17590, partial [Rhodospirillales bacterium]|nr:hypothetical protein [Rhodospirillales bacterium]
FRQGGRCHAGLWCNLSHLGAMLANSTCSLSWGKNNTSPSNLIFGLRTKVVKISDLIVEYQLCFTDNIHNLT